MANPATISWIGFGWETTYGSASASIDKPFGHGVRVTALTPKNNVERVYDMGSQTATKLPVKKFEGTVTTEFILASPWFMKAFMGTVADGGSAPYTHTYSETNPLPSMTLVNNIQTDTAEVRSLLGCVVKAWSLTSAVGELVRCKLDMNYANETMTTTTTSKLSESYELYTFAQGSVELPSSSTLAMVQNIELTGSRNTEQVWGQGSRFSQANPAKNIEHGATITMAKQTSSDFLTKFYGASTAPSNTVAETATMKLTFTNGLTGTNTRSIVLTYTGVQIDEVSMPQDPTQLILEDVPLIMRSLSIVASDNTQTAK